jgi:geranylgeranyl diphosphate synthase type II
VTVEARLEAQRRRVEQALSDALPDESAWPATIHRAVRYSLFAGGKRVRPLLALAAAEAVGGETDEAMPLAVAVEMVHTYSLIHDDLPCMDNDDLRRGKPTSHKVFGEAVAVLAGDALLTRAFHLLAGVPASFDAERLRRRLQATVILGEAAGTRGLIGGQVEDLEHEGRAIGPEALERLHRAKTGALLTACVHGGAVLGGARPTELAALQRYGAAVGLAFQVVDDVLDATEDAAQLGKTAGKDQAAAKATYVRLHGLAGARDIAARLLDEAESAVAPLHARAELLLELARRMVWRRG